MNNTFTPKSAAPKSGERKFPLIVVEPKSGSKATIYRDDDRGKDVFIITFYAEGQRQRIVRREFEDAFKVAQQVVTELGTGGQDVLPLWGKERRVYEGALDLLRPTGLALDVAVAQLVECVTILNGVASLRACLKMERGCVAAQPQHGESTPNPRNFGACCGWSGTTQPRSRVFRQALKEAAELTKRHRPKIATNITVQAVVDELVKAKGDDGLSELHVRDLRTRLSRFAKSFRCPIAD